MAVLIKKLVEKHLNYLKMQTIPAGINLPEFANLEPIMAAKIRLPPEAFSQTY